MNLHNVLKNFQRNVPGCVVARIVDIDSDPAGRRHRQKPSGGPTAATLGELVLGRDMTAIEDMFKRMPVRHEDGRPRCFQEILIVSGDRMHLFQRCRRNPNKVLATICHKEANLGVVMGKSRDMLEIVDLVI